jgi:hypothetical protein
VVADAEVWQRERGHENQEDRLTRTVEKNERPPLSPESVRVRTPGSGTLFNRHYGDFCTGADITIFMLSIDTWHLAAIVSGLRADVP